MILLFDIDGTLTEPMKTVEPETLQAIQKIKDTHNVRLGIIGGSDAEKAKHQLGDKYRELFEFCFHENGCVFYHHETLQHKQTLEDFVPVDKLNQLVSFIQHLLSITPVPFKTGTFIERRSCTLNVSPVGRGCSDSQRKEFYEYDKKHQIRKHMVERIQSQFPDLPIEIAIGGMISIDIYPTGLNKTHCLKFLPADEKEIHFFGDKCDKGGNDYELYTSPKVNGHCVTSPEDTIQQLYAIFEN